MIFTDNMLFDVLFILALVGVLVVYLVMRSKVKKLQKENTLLSKKYTKLQTELDSTKKELGLEIRARDRKLEIADEKYLTLQSDCQTTQKVLKEELEKKNNLLASFNSSTTDTPEEEADKE